MSEQQIEPIVIDLEPQAEEVAKLEKTPPVAENAEPAQAEPDKPSDDNKADKTFTQAELDEIVQKRITKLERKMEKQRIEAETRARVMEEVSAPKVDVANKPKVEDYSDYADFIEDLTDWKTEQKLKSAETTKAQERERQSQLSEQERTNERQRELIETGERKYDDFEEVVKADKTVLSRAGYLSILESDISADIVYHLAKHQEDAKRISELPAYAQAKEIGKLEDKLLAKTPVKASNAPKPIEPIGSGTASTKTIDEMSPEEYIKYRKKQNPRWA